jgi:hypothetical protein
MDPTGTDLHRKDSRIRSLRAEGEPIEQRVRTTPARFADVLGDRPRTPPRVGLASVKHVNYRP